MRVPFTPIAAVVFALLGSACCYRQLVRKASEAEAKPNDAPVGNDCPQTAPWPCKSGRCLSFAFICDGRKDCPDGFDEDKALCIAKDRPASIILERFINQFHDWLVPNILGQGSPKQLAKLLTEERSLRDYARKVGMTEAQKQNLLRTMEFARDGRVLDLIMDGMPEDAYREAYALFGRIVESGFLGYDAARK